jgi:hypothetical protein
MSLCFSHARGSKRDGPGVQNEKLFWGNSKIVSFIKCPSSMACEVRCDQRHTVSIEAWRDTARGAAQPEDWCEARVCLKEMRKIVGVCGDLSCVRRALVPLGCAANALTEIDQRDVA